MRFFTNYCSLIPCNPKELPTRFAAVAKIITCYPQFFTATILDWKKLLKADKYKDIIIKSMGFLVKDRRVIIYGFVIMINHIHLIWQMQAGIERSNLQRDFLKFTAQKFKRDLQKNHPNVLPHFLVKAKDREVSVLGKKPIID